MRNRKQNNRGVALVTTLIFLSTVVVAVTSYVGSTTSALRLARHREMDLRLLNLCEAGFQAELVALWIPFKVSQRFDAMDAAYPGASPENPLGVISGSYDGVGAYTVGIVGYDTPDTYNRFVTLRAVGFQDANNNGQLDPGEPYRTVETVQKFSLDRSGVFDYAYFANNYGWMTGFGQVDLIVNGDMRANGDFTISDGIPTINGSIYACANNRLVPPAQGIVNIAPYQWSNAAYTSDTDTRKRQAYDPAVHGEKGSEQYEQWRDLIYDAEASVVNGRFSGSVLADSRGVRDFRDVVLDTNPTKELTLPDLNDLNYYINLSQTWVDQKATFGDGTANPDYGQEPYIEVWNSSLGRYVRVTTDGVYNGSIGLVGTSSKPIKIHGPVTVTHDAVIKGYVQGQGTLYTGRNVHIVGSIIYKNPPSFVGSSPESIDARNEKKDVLALAARGSIIMGNTKKFGTIPLRYMTPPFTKGRYDDLGNWIPPFDARSIDSYGIQRYAPLLGHNYVDSISSNINQLDCILYTNFVGGGNIGGGGTGVTFNGSIICKDEAMVLWSLPMKMNYDNRIRERALTNSPLIDIALPRSPSLTRAVWQSKGMKNY
ncbi:MAG: hypothetical protein AMXMBFR61_01600 [Fimbriimonadales bacterium]